MQALLTISRKFRIVAFSSAMLCADLLGSVSAAGQCPGPGLPCPPLSDGSPGGYVMCRIHKIQADVTPYVKSYMEVKPADFESNPTRKYPLLVYLGGTGEQFQIPDNNTQELCQTLYWSMPSRINSGQF